MQDELIEYLRGFVSEARWKRINQVLENRTQHITVVLEDIYQPHNASAVLRSCDGFGIQDVHIIENRNQFDVSSEVTIGSDQWLTLHRYNKPEQDNVAACFERLRTDGYQIIATTPHEYDSDLNTLSIEQPTALVFGTELEGVTEQVMKQADGYVKIPMFGFSESFNISVSAAICLYDTSTRVRSSGVKWELSWQKKQDMLLEWLKKSIKAGDQLAEQWIKERTAG